MIICSPESQKGANFSSPALVNTKSYMMHVSLNYLRTTSVQASTACCRGTNQIHVKAYLKAVADSLTLHDEETPGAGSRDASDVERI
jgi:hypothetical protein